MIRSQYGNVYLIWLDPATGDITYLGHGYLAAGSSKGRSWSAGSCGALFSTLDSFDPNVFYCLVGLSGGGSGVLAVRYPTGNNNLDVQFSQGGNTWGSTATLVNAGGSSIEELVASFAAQDPSGLQVPDGLGCTLNYVHPGADRMYAAFRCTAGGGQDRYGWSVVMDLMTGQVVAARPTHGVYPWRYCTLHGASSRYISGSLYTAQTLKVMYVSPSTWCGTGPLRTELTATMANTGNTACPTGDAFSTWSDSAQVCTQATVTGEPYDADPSSCTFDNNNSQRGAAGPYGAAQVAALGDKFLIGSDGDTTHPEVLQLVAKDGNNWTFLRGVNRTYVRQHSGANLTMLGLCSTGFSHYNSMEGGYDFWDIVADPHGKNQDSSYFVLGNQHSMSKFDRILAAGYQYYEGTIPQMTAMRKNNTYTFITATPPFAGVGGFNGNDSHLSIGQDDPTQYWFMDVWPFFSSNSSNYTATPTGTTGRVWKLRPTLNRKNLPTHASCGKRPLADVSGPGALLSEGADGANQYCVALSAGECWPGSSAGDVYVNCEDLTRGTCTDLHQDGGINDSVEPCVSNAGSRLQSVLQVGVLSGVPDQAARLSRVLTHLMSTPRRTITYANAVTVPDSSWVLSYTIVTGGWNAVWGAKVPPFPAADSVNRSTYIPVTVTVKSVPAGTSNVIAEFGYGPEFRCTSRRERCVAASTGQVNEAAPFYWKSETYSGLACASGCSMTIPAIPQRVLYYRLVYRDASNNELEPAGSTQVMAVP